MPPTRAAASTTYVGRSRAKNPSTAAASDRSSSSRVRVTMRWNPSALSRRTAAEPTKPRWPATKIGAARSSTSDSRALSPAVAVVAQHAFLLGQLEVAVDHHRDELLERRPWSPP